uniref:Ovule protein n=1 Tax=Parascaris univalens TaxID=6257 RepID=A0A915CHE1_PARUN
MQSLLMYYSTSVGFNEESDECTPDERRANRNMFPCVMHSLMCNNPLNNQITSVSQLCSMQLLISCYSNFRLMLH